MSTKLRPVQRQVRDPLRDDILDTAVAKDLQVGNLPLAPHTLLDELERDAAIVAEDTYVSEKIVSKYTQLNGKDFDIIDIISSDGASSQVYEGQYLGEEGITPNVAIKSLHKKEKLKLGEISNLAKLAIKETSNLERMNHPNLPKTHGMYSTKDEFGFTTYNIVMEHVKGESLADKIGNYQSVPTILDWASQLLGGLEYLHTSGEGRSAHRDIKPQNIREGEDGLLKILDLGLFTQAVDKTFGTSFRTVAGTPKYISPEQIQGYAVPASDIYGLGITLYELFMGEEIKGWEFGKTYQKLEFQALEEKISNDTIPRYIAKKITSIVRDMTRSDIETRYKSAQEALDDVSLCMTALIDGEGVDLGVHVKQNEWDIPAIEATSFATTIIQSGRRDVQKIDSLFEYIDTNPVTVRDSIIIHKTIQMIHDEVSDEDISKELEEYNTNFSELICGYTRNELQSKYDRSIGRKNEVDMKSNESFINLIESCQKNGYTSETLDSVIDKFKNALSNRSLSVPRKQFLKNLKKVKKGKYDERVEELKIKYGEHPNLQNPKYQALLITAENSMSTKDSIDPRCLDSPFGTLRKELLPGAMFGDISCIPVIAYYFNQGMVDTSYSGLNTLELMALSVLPLVLPVATGLVAENFSYFKNTFLDNVCFENDTTTFYSHLQDMLESVPEIEQEKLPSLLDQIQKESSENLTPYQILDKVKEVYEK